MEKRSVAFCGLPCGLCRKDGSCCCRGDHCCGKRTLSGGCKQYLCCQEKKLPGCWACKDFPCEDDAPALNQIKARAFVRFIQEDGIEAFCDALEDNQTKGILYHRFGVWGEEPIFGDYDLTSEHDTLLLLRKAHKKARTD